MSWITAFLIFIMGTAWASLSQAADGERSSQQPAARERLNQFLDAEGGTTVHMDAHGNVETLLQLPNGERRVVVQPPQSPGMNVGPPLQLNNRTFQLPPPPPAPAQPPAPEFPQKAR